MAKTDTRYRIAYNRMLEFCDQRAEQEQLPSELALAEKMDVSRTVIRSVLRTLHDRGIIRWDGREKRVLRRPVASDRMVVDTENISDEELEERFFDWILRFDVPPGTALNVTQLSKQFSVTPHTLQEFLASLLRFALVERRAPGGWRLLGFTPDFAVELSDFRVLIEQNAVQRLVHLPANHPVWPAMDRLETQHHALLRRLDTDFRDFSKLDEVFHRTICGVVRNRFAAEFQKVISLIFHYHYQWNKADERERNEAAIAEHLRLIEALRVGDEAAALSASQEHLDTSKETLLASLASLPVSSLANPSRGIAPVLSQKTAARRRLAS